MLREVLLPALLLLLVQVRHGLLLLLLVLMSPVDHLLQKVLVLLVQLELCGCVLVSAERRRRRE